VEKDDWIRVTITGFDEADRRSIKKSEAGHALHLGSGAPHALASAAMARMTINGEGVEYKLDPDTPLLWALRDASNLTGTKYGCDSRDCGACTVIIDGRAVTSCSVTLRELEGATITTIEGLGGNHPAQQAWIAEQVTMCGYCEPGFIMAIAALLQASPAPSEEQVAALPNICRCGSYPRIRKAIARAAQAAAAPAPPPQG
jgi:isoquinoline 1-oxidoreductase subunit alpha